MKVRWRRAGVCGGRCLVAAIALGLVGVRPGGAGRRCGMQVGVPPWGVGWSPPCRRAGIAAAPRLPLLLPQRLSRLGPNMNARSEYRATAHEHHIVSLVSSFVPYIWIKRLNCAGNFWAI